MEEDSVLRLTFARRSGLAAAIELSVDLSIRRQFFANAETKANVAEIIFDPSDVVRFFLAVER